MRLRFIDENTVGIAPRRIWWLRFVTDRNRNKSHWAVVASYFRSEDDPWIDNFIVDDGLEFSKVVAANDQGSWHFDRGRTTGMRRWIGHLQQVRKAMSLRPDGIITSFPQPAMIAGLLKRLYRTDTKIIAYTFNLGALPQGWRQRLARFAAARIDRFVVHSPTEVEPYAAYLGVPKERVIFAPLQRGDLEVERAEDVDAPFVVALGSAHRDYPTLIKAVDQLEMPTIIVTRPADVDTLPQSKWVTFKSHLSQQECHALLAQARICVTPVANLETASGQITFVDSLRLGVPTIATRCPGTEGYITHDENGILVRPFDSDDLAAQLAMVWNDPTLRDRLTQAAIKDAQARFTDQTAANRLQDIIKSVQDA